MGASQIGLNHRDALADRFHNLRDQLKMISRDKFYQDYDTQFSQFLLALKEQLSVDRNIDYRETANGDIKRLVYKDTNWELLRDILHLQDSQGNTIFHLLAQHLEAAHFDMLQGVEELKQLRDENMGQDIPPDIQVRMNEIKDNINKMQNFIDDVKNMIASIRDYCDIDFSIPNSNNQTPFDISPELQAWYKGHHFGLAQRDHALADLNKIAQFEIVKDKNQPDSFDPNANREGLMAMQEKAAVADPDAKKKLAAIEEIRKIVGKTQGWSEFAKIGEPKGIKALRKLCDRFTKLAEQSSNPEQLASKIWKEMQEAVGKRNLGGGNLQSLLYKAIYSENFRIIANLADELENRLLRDMAKDFNDPFYRASFYAVPTKERVFKDENPLMGQVADAPGLKRDDLLRTGLQDRVSQVSANSISSEPAQGAIQAERPKHEVPNKPLPPIPPQANQGAPTPTPPTAQPSGLAANLPPAQKAERNKREQLQHHMGEFFDKVKEKGGGAFNRAREKGEVLLNKIKEQGEKAVDSVKDKVKRDDNNKPAGPKPR